MPKTIHIEQLSSTLVKIAEHTKGTAYENNLWLVGGAVRDWLRSKVLPKDFDIVVEGDALKLANYLNEQKLTDISPVIYPRFGTAYIQIGGNDIELVTARKESYDDQSRKPDVEPASLLEDAQRRDFTINSLMINLHSGELLDPLEKGVEDLQNGVLRTPLDPSDTFYEDPLRMLRAIRFRWQLQCRPVDGLYEAIQKQSDRLRIISMERIRDELSKMLLLNDADRCTQDLGDLGLLDMFAPELSLMKGVGQGDYHHLDVWGHTLLTLKNVNKKSLILSLAALLHDVAKPQTKFIDEKGRIRFFGHENRGAEMARDILSRLKFSNETIAKVCILVKAHMRTTQALTDTALRRLMRDLGDQLDNLLLLSEADAKAHRPGTCEFDRIAVEQKLRQLSEAVPSHLLKSPLSGAEIMKIFQLSPGPEVGKIKEFLAEQVITGKLSPDEKEKAVRLVNEQPSFN